MKKTWRWFGPSDKISLEMLRQIGVEGIVTALHDIPSGEVWPVERIDSLKRLIESHGMYWAVVESLPVSEQIKYAGPDTESLLANYRQSLENLGKCGIKTVCYNFMPVIDWARTDLDHLMPDGTRALYFDYARFAYFDIYILEREGARDDYPQDVLARADALKGSISSQEEAALIDSIIIKTQGFVNGPMGSGDGSPVQKFKALMEPYKGVSKEQLRQNLKYFLESVMP
ncbi:MAG: mannonate dehydratase, partial [Bacteroidales bacterium]|nr:mannonate dehydratase [Bacteroidales bacterium]